MKNLEEVMNAFARVLDKPRNPLYAMQELMEKLDAHGREALREYDEVTDIINGLVDTQTVTEEAKEVKVA